MNDTDKDVIKKYESELKEHDVPPIEISNALVNTAMNRRVDDVDFWNMGKHMQMHFRLNIPYECQHEVVAGYWQWLKIQMPEVESLFDDFESLSACK